MAGQIKVISKSNLNTEIGWIDFYVGRPSSLGNPFIMKSEADRSKVIAKYKIWLWKEICSGNPYVTRGLQDILWTVYSGEDVRLVCYCNPKACHADVIKACVEWLLPKKLTFSWLQEITKHLRIDFRKLDSPQPRNIYESRRGFYKGKYSVNGWLCRNLEEVYAHILDPMYDSTEFND